MCSKKGRCNGADELLLLLIASMHMSNSKQQHYNNIRHKEQQINTKIISNVYHYRAPPTCMPVAQLHFTNASVEQHSCMASGVHFNNASWILKLIGFLHTP